MWCSLWACCSLGSGHLQQDLAGGGAPRRVPAMNSSIVAGRGSTSTPAPTGPSTAWQGRAQVGAGSQQQQQQQQQPLLASGNSPLAGWLSSGEGEGEGADGEGEEVGAALVAALQGQSTPSDHGGLGMRAEGGGYGRLLGAGGSTASGGGSAPGSLQGPGSRRDQGAVSPAAELQQGGWRAELRAAVHEALSPGHALHEPGRLDGVIERLRRLSEEAAG